MATLGPTASGTTANSQSATKRTRWYIGQMPEDGTLDSITFDCDGFGGAGGFSIAVYVGATASSTSGLVLISSGTGTALSGTQSQITVSLSGSLSSGDHIFFAYQRDPGSGGSARAYTNASSGYTKWTDDRVGAYPEWPDPWTQATNFSSNQAACYITYTPAVSRSITSIDGDNSIKAGQTDIDIIVVGLDADPVSKVVELEGETLTVNSWSPPTINVDCSGDVNIKWGTTANTLSITDDTGTVTLNNVTLAARDGWDYVNWTGPAPDPDETESFYEEAIADLGITAAAGDQLCYTESAGLTVDGAWVPTIDPAADATGTYKVFDASGSGFSADTAYQILQDITPDSFTFASQLSAAISSVLTSNTVTISGLGETAVDLTVSNGTYSKNGGGYTSTAGTITNGDTINVRHTSSATPGASVVTTLTVGDTSVTFTSTTTLGVQLSAGIGLTVDVGLAGGIGLTNSAGLSR